eukprot:c15262_g2_i1.p1 GENE.c15262_g2_i1~~c15262_g2_i1.p1  ORF type:complete len:397 (-),score=176.53 c15262_g2_i1:30-1172(-)
MEKTKLSVFVLFLLTVVSDGLIRPRKTSLPEGPILVGYAPGQDCDEKFLQSATQGVNVIIWFSINLIRNTTTNQPEIQGGPNFDCVANVAMKLHSMNLETVHLISIGGWDAPHIDTTFSSLQWWNALQKWNNQTVARGGFLGFDGIDWDIEGNDDLSSPYNNFTFLQLNTIGEISLFAKQNNFIVSLAPAESYFDVTTGLFDLSLTHPYPEWHSEFLYHGHNAYTYLWAKYQTAFDFVSVQFYESWSHADYQISMNLTSPSDYIQEWTENITKGWTVNFSDFEGCDIPTQVIKVDRNRLVVGLANGWTGGGKAILIWPEDAGDAYLNLKLKQKEPKGFMFWNIRDEGDVVPGTNKTLWLTPGLNHFLNIRNTTIWMTESQ